MKYEPTFYAPFSFLQARGAEKKLAAMLFR